MKILVAPDSFKGSLKSTAAARAMSAGVRAAVPDAQVIELPVGDGGEGTLEALVAATGGSFEAHPVEGPLGEQVDARLGLLGDGETVFVEMAEASGLSRLEPERRDPLRASTFGTGQLLRAAVETGRPRLLIGIGGSATNDGGAGMLEALGIRLLDERGSPLPRGGAALSRLSQIDCEGFVSPREVEIVVACDVTNPLLGPHGASAIYGPQKGADAAQIRELDAALARWAAAMAEKVGKDWKEAPGAGAAGGVGFALLAFLGARLERGVALVLEAIGFERHLAGADLVLTGEGRIDRQTLSYGKTLAGIGEAARKVGVPVIAVTGSLGEDLGDYRAAGIQGVASAVSRPMTLEAAMGDAAGLLESATRRTVEIVLVGRTRSVTG